MRLVDGLVVLLYMGFMVWVGWATKKNVHESRDFVASQNKLPFSVTLATLVATLIGAGLTVGQAGQAPTAGAALIGGQMGWYLCFVVFALLGNRFKRSGYVSIPEMIGARFGLSARVLTSILVFIYCVLLLGLQFAAVGRVIGYIGAPFGITPTMGAVAACVIVIFYTSLSGMFGVAYTDLIQFILMWVGVVIVLPLFAVKFAGGFGAVQAFADARSISLWNPISGSITGLITLMFIFFIDTFVEPPAWQRMASAKDSKTLRKAFLWALPAIVLYAYGVVVSGVSGASLFPNIKDLYGTTEAVIPVVITQVMPPVISGLLLAALLAAIMSTMDSYLLVCSSSLSYDILKYVRPDTSEKTLVKVLKWSTVGIGAAALLASLAFKGVWDMLVFAFTVYPAAVAPVLAAAFFWRKATPSGAISAMLIGFIVTLYLSVKGILLWGLDPVFTGAGTTIIVLVIVSLLTYNKNKETPLIGEETRGKKTAAAPASAD